MNQYNKYQSPFADRYGSDIMRNIWSEDTRRLIFREIWCLIAKGQYKCKLVTKEELEDLEEHKTDINIEAAREIEKEVKHELMSELLLYTKQCAIGGGKLHYGCTSSDILDNTDAHLIKRSLDVLKSNVSYILKKLKDLINSYKDVQCLGLTHLQPALPITIGFRLSQYAQDFCRDYKNLKRLEKIIVGKGLRGAVGTSASFKQMMSDCKCGGLLELYVEDPLMKYLNINAPIVSTQTYPRKQDYEVLNVLAGIAQSAHRFAMDMRLLQSPLAEEWQECFSEGQVGSSAMPFKKNPINCENICSLCRQLSSMSQVAWQNAANGMLERTLDDSANRRIMLPESFLMCDEILTRVLDVLNNGQYDALKSYNNVQEHFTDYAKEKMLLKAVKNGANRQEFHKVLQNCHFEFNKNEEIKKYLKPDEIDECLSSKYIGHAGKYCTSMIIYINEVLNEKDYNGTIYDNDNV